MCVFRLTVLVQYIYAAATADPTNTVSLYYINRWPRDQPTRGWLMAYTVYSEVSVAHTPPRTTRQWPKRM